jgi:hypothetical protein
MSDEKKLAAPANAVEVTLIEPCQCNGNNLKKGDKVKVLPEQQAWMKEQKLI